MSMSGQPKKSPPCSSHTPTQDPNEVDPETAHGTNEEQGAYPRFLVVDGKDSERPLSGIHQVIVVRTIRGCTSASVHVERMGKAYLVKVHCKTYADSLLSLGMVQDCQVQVTPHRSLNSSRGVVQFGRSAKGLSTEDIIEEISTSPRNEEVPEITSANRASIQKNGSKIPNGTFFLTFNSECLPTYLFLGFERFKVERYLSTPRRCFKCQKFGHGSKTCRSKEDICSICASTDHSYKDCIATGICVITVYVSLVWMSVLSQWYNSIDHIRGLINHVHVIGSLSNCWELESCDWMFSRDPWEWLRDWRGFSLSDMIRGWKQTLV